MFNLRKLSRIRKRTQNRKIRGVLEVLENRKLMAGDLNMGAYVIGAVRPDIDQSPAIVQPIQTAHDKATSAEAIVDSLDASRVDAVLVEDHLIPPHFFLPPCPVQPPMNGSQANSVVGNGVAGLTKNDPTNSEPSDWTSGTSTSTTESRDRTGANPKTTSEIRLNYPLSATSIHSGILLAIAGANEAALQDSTIGEESRYFTADGSRPSSDGPSLANQSLSPYVESDTFMAMGLLPSPLTANQHDDHAFAIQIESHSYQTRSSHIDAWDESQDLNSLREEASVIDVGEVVDPLPFLGAGTSPISSAMISLVGVDFYDLDSESAENGDASLMAKISKNRIQFAAFAFVFTIVTVRMNSADSKRDKPGSLEELEDSQDRT